MKNVLLIIPPSPNTTQLVEKETSMEEEFNSSPSLGLGYVASALPKNQFQVKGYDARFDQEKSLREISNKILYEEPDIIGFTSVTLAYNNVIRLSKYIKEENPRIQIVVGGTHVSGRLNAHPEEKPISQDTLQELNLHKYSMAEACLRGTKFESQEFQKIKGEKLIDAVVIGDCFDWSTDLFLALSENKKKNLEEKLNNINGVAYIDSKGNFKFTGERNGPKNLSSLTYPTRDIFPMKKYIVPGTLITSHGCPMLCSYCTCPFTSNRKYLPGKVEYSIKEMKELSQKFGITNFRLNDDVATINKKWMSSFSKELIKLKKDGTKFSWSCFGRVDQINEDLLKSMANAGCVTIQYGIETGSEKILQSINKGGKANTQRAISAIRATINLGIPFVRAGMIVGFPEETEETICEDFDLIEKLYEIGKEKIEISVATLTPYPGSLDGDRAIQGYYNNKTKGTKEFRPIDFNFDRYAFQEINVITKNFPTEKAMKEMYGTLFGAMINVKDKIHTRVLSQNS